jgi:hypothetical protein
VTPATASAVVVRRVGVLRVLLVLLLVLWLFWRYFVAPVLDGIDRVTPWDGAVPGSCTAAPTVRPAGFSGLVNDAGLALRNLAQGPPTPVQMVGWFEVAGREAKTLHVAFEQGVGGRQLLPLAQTPEPRVQLATANTSGLAAWVTQPGMTWDPVKAAAVALAESGGDPRAVNATATSNGRAHGLFQTLLPLHTDRLAGGDWSDPMLNARVAHELYLESGWAPWAASAAQHGRYEAQARALLDGVTVAPVTGCAQEPGVLQVSGSNGQLDEARLQTLSWTDGSLQPAAASALEQLNVAYRTAFGQDITVTDTYRTLAGQHACTRAKGSLCAVPGTSNHGLGVAVDLGGGIERFGTPQHEWMVTNGPAYGWVLPEWAQQGGSKPEPWHWEYGRRRMQAG